MFQFRCDLVQTVGDDPTFLQRQMQGLVGLVGKELIVPDLLPERRAPDQIGMEQQALRGGRLHSRGVVQTDDLAGSERYDRALLIVVPAASVGQFAAYFLFEEQGVEPDVHLVGNQLLGSVQIDDSDQRVPGLDAEQLVVLVDRVHLNDLVRLHGLRILCRRQM